MSACAQAPNQSSVVKYGATSGPGSTGAHTIFSGDTLSGVSVGYRLSLEDIIALNDLMGADFVTVGKRIDLPPPQNHKVREDDTVMGIARTYNVDPDALVRLNNLNPPYTLVSGEILELPTPKLMAEQDRIFVPQETVRTANVGRVEREPLASTETHSQNSAVLPSKKPNEQVSQTARAQKTSTRPQVVKEQSVPKSSGNGRFMMPVDGNIISSFGPKKNGLHNDGINIKAARGTPVRAAENGRVVYVGDDLEGYGNLVLVRHEGRYMSAYAHLDKSLVSKGDTVKRGQSLGTVGSSGQVDTPQLHFEIRKGTKALNPQRYL